jgi:hypothetical protein
MRRIVTTRSIEDSDSDFQGCYLKPSPFRCSPLLSEIKILFTIQSLKSREVFCSRDCFGLVIHDLGVSFYRRGLAPGILQISLTRVKLGEECDFKSSFVNTHILKARTYPTSGVRQNIKHFNKCNSRPVLDESFSSRQRLVTVSPVNRQVCCQVGFA